MAILSSLAQNMFHWMSTKLVGPFSLLHLQRNSLCFPLTFMGEILGNVHENEPMMMSARRPRTAVESIVMSHTAPAPHS